MNLLLALEPPFGQSLLPPLRAALAPLEPVHVSTSDELAERLDAEPWEIVVTSAALVQALAPGTRARLAEGELIVILERLIEPADLIHVMPDDFLLVDGPEGAARAVEELAARIRQAQRRVVRRTRELQRNEAVARAVEDIVYRLDDAGRIVYVNESIVHLGYAPEELLGRHFSELLEPDQVERVSREAVLPGLRGRVTGEEGAPRLFDERRRGARRTRQLEIVLRGAGAMRDSTFVGVVTASGEVVARVAGGHEVVGTIGVIRRDPSDSRTTDVLRSLFLVAESAPYGIVIADAGLRVDYANPAFYRRFELPPSSVTGRLLSEIDLPILGGRLMETLHDVANDGAAVSEVVSPNGSGAWTRSVHPVTGPRGEVTALLITFLPDADASPATGERLVELRQVIAQAVDEFRSETGASVPVVVEVRERATIPDALAELLASSLRTLLEFAELVTGGAPSTVAAHAAEGGPIVSVSAARAPGDRSVPPAPDPMRLSALAERSEALRARVEAAGGAWSVERGERQIAFALRLPAGGGAGDDAAEEADEHESPGTAIDRFRSIYRDNPEVMTEILRLYAREAPQRLETIRAGLSAGDASAVIPAAHSLANTSGTLQAPRAVEAARSLEAAARQDDLDAARTAAERLRELVEELVASVNAALNRED